jgi:DNA-binding transcriptional LysR family regulator
MHITFRQLKIFETVAQRLSYTRAAEELHLSQPAVSMQIRQLEESIGLDMFEKLGKRIQLTEAGKELLFHSEKISYQLKEAKEVLEAMKSLSQGRLKLAVASTVNYFAPKLLAGFSKRYPNVKLHLDVTNRKQIIQLLELNETDLVLMGQPPEELELESVAFMDNPMVIIAPPEHPLVGTSKIPLKRIAEEVFVVREAGSGTRIAMEKVFTANDLTLRLGMEMTRNETIKQAVRAGLGLSMVSQHTIELELETQRLRVLDVENFPILRRWYLVYRVGKRLSPVAEAFKQFLLTEYAQLDAKT